MNGWDVEPISLYLFWILKWGRSLFYTPLYQYFKASVLTFWMSACILSRSCLAHLSVFWDNFILFIYLFFKEMQILLFIWNRCARSHAGLCVQLFISKIICTRIKGGGARVCGPSGRTPELGSCGGPKLWFSYCVSEKLFSAVNESSFPFITAFVATECVRVFWGARCQCYPSSHYGRSLNCKLKQTGCRPTAFFFSSPGSFGSFGLCTIITFSWVQITFTFVFVC